MGSRSAVADVSNSTATNVNENMMPP